ncbi:MAG: glycoside hydrolase family 125 protein [Hyphomicrobiaceae bacterium]|nr:glycoside hydrolase family 125 protein [Hyphomicrobiaceae bacterium]
MSGLSFTPPRHVPGEGLVPWNRPEPRDRQFRSAAIERRIAHAAERIAEPGLRRLFENAFPNTLDTTIVTGGSDARPDTFVLTGDIPAMWLRDSTSQVWPYLSSVTKDPELDRLVRGIIHRQSDQILLDPYANAFLPNEEPGEWAGDETDMRPGVHERKWEPDSISSFFRLSAAYWRIAGSTRPFDDQWRSAFSVALGTLRTEQRRDRQTPYRFHRPNGDPTDFVADNGRGLPTRPNGMVHGAFRPSDDASQLSLNVPVNLALAASLEAASHVAAAIGASGEAAEALTLAGEIRSGVAADGVAGETERIWAYEIDGLGNRVMMDDANVPSLLSLPYLGACAADNPVYRATRRWILSNRNPWWFEGSAARGIGSPHTGPSRVWPIAVAMQGLTATSADERRDCAKMLATTHAGTYLAHESFDPSHPATFTRPWFAWANSLVGEFLEKAALEGLLE